MRNKFIYLTVLFSLLFAGGCAKRETLEEPVGEIESETELEASNDSPRFIHTGVQGSEESGIYSYYLLPEQNEVEIELAGDTEEDWRTYISELVSFTETDDGIEFTYINEEGEEIEKTFEILSKSIVIDEEKNRFEW